MKAEPLKRVVKGLDVAFSVDHFEKVKKSSWEGVRNYQARNFLRDQMKKGHHVLFYHSNCKLPGIVALATVCIFFSNTLIERDGYPDHTAWDSKHPYFDAKSDPDNPRWYMVDVEFVRRLPHMVPLALLQHLASSDFTESQHKDVQYLTEKHINALRGMALLNRSRLSVQVCGETTDEVACGRDRV